MSNARRTILYVDRVARCAMGSAEDAVAWVHQNSKKRVKVRIHCRRTRKSLYDPGLSRIEPELANWDRIRESVVSMKFTSVEDATIFKLFWGEMIVPEDKVFMHLTIPGGESIRYAFTQTMRMTCKTPKRTSA